MGATKFHVNYKDGTVGACRAESGKCPFGGDENHYTSMVAAAKAYEDSMSDQVFVSSSKQTPAATQLFSFKIPEDYNVDSTMTEQELREIENLDSEASEDIYYKIRQEVGPALTHFESKELMYYWAKNMATVGGMTSWNQLLNARGSNSSLYESVREYVNNGTERVYRHFPEKSELTENLVEKAQKAIAAERRYGFPEDELDRSMQDAREKEYLKAISILSGEDVSTVRKKLISTMALERPHAQLTLDELQHKIGVLDRRIQNLKNRDTIARRSQELAALQREVILRKVKAAPRRDALRMAAESNYISKDDALKLIGVPTAKEMSTMDAKTLLWWK